MKKYILISVVILMASSAWSQSDKAELDLMQAAFGKEKRTVVAEFVKPSPSETDAFWKLYDEYEAQRKELGRNRIELLEHYVNTYLTMTGVDADAWATKVIALQQKNDTLMSSYYKKIEKISDGVVATQFYMIETSILAAVRAEILQKVPFLPNKN